MTSLVSLSDVSTRLALGATVPAELSALLLQIMDDTTYVLEQMLGTSFDRTTRADIFYLDSRREKPFVGNNAWLRTKQGFIDSGATFEIRSALTIQELPNPTPDDLSGVQVDYDRGKIILGSSNYIGVVDRKLYPQEWDEHYVQVDYTAGFTELSGVYNGVPNWLQSIALSVTADTYRTEKGCGKKGSCTQTCAEKAAKYYARIEDKLRFLPAAYDPMI